MYFYFATLENPYDICLAIYGNNCHSITFYLPVGALQLVALPSMCALLTKERRRTQHFIFFICDRRFG
jgi:hypothetical protein